MAAPEALLQRRIGPFILGRKLGAGGMATVYAAREETQHVRRLVALKVLSPNIQQDDAEHRAFLREAEIATRLEHPNIVRIFDVGEVDGAMYIAMELVHGASLFALLKAAQGPAPMPIALRIVSDVASALHHAHELADPNHGALGVVHQDVSPQNVLVSYEGGVKLVDFGVARLSTFEGSRTETLRGKPSYASPEQIAGRNIDRRTDVFALGIIAWELMTGERLFRRETNAATYLAVIQGPVPYVREKNPSVPAVIADQIARALEREREARFKSAEAFRAALSDAATEARIAEATAEELAGWAARLVPPTHAKDELDDEIAKTLIGVAPRLNAALAAPLIIHAAVPDLDLPIVDPTANTPTTPVPKPTISAAPALILVPARSGPALQAQAAPELAPSSSRTRAIAPDAGHDDDFDMEIERDTAGAAMTTAASSRSSGAMRAAPPPRVAPTASGLDLAAQRSGLRDHADHHGPSVLARVAAVVVPLVLSGGALAALVKLAHRRDGLEPLRVMPHAFDGASVAQSGAVAIASFVVALALGAFGLKLRPRSWAMVGAGAATLLAALAMVTVTLASSGESPTPPDGALLVPYLAPLALACLAIGLAGRGRQLMLDDGVGRRLAALPVAALAGAVAFLAVESSRLASLLD